MNSFESIYWQAVQGIFAMQIGAMDGKLDESSPDKLDSVYKGVTQENWKAVIFEPHPVHFKELEANYANARRVTLVNKAIGLYCGETDMFESELRGAHTLVESVLVANKGYGHTWRPIKVSCMDVPTCFATYGVPDKLFIDAEGFDGTIIESIDLSKFQIPYIRFEYVHVFQPQLDEVINKLRRYHYRLSFRWGRKVPKSITTIIPGENDIIAEL